jgi:hypothetical protein
MARHRSRDREGQVRSGLSPGGKWIRTLGPSRGFRRSELLARKPTSWSERPFPAGGAMVRISVCAAEQPKCSSAELAPEKARIACCSEDLSRLTSPAKQP